MHQPSEVCLVEVSIKGTDGGFQTTMLIMPSNIQLILTLPPPFFLFLPVCKATSKTWNTLRELLEGCDDGVHLRLDLRGSYWFGILLCFRALKYAWFLLQTTTVSIKNVQLIDWGILIMGNNYGKIEIKWCEILQLQAFSWYIRATWHLNFKDTEFTRMHVCIYFLDIRF